MFVLRTFPLSVFVPLVQLPGKNPMSFTWHWAGIGATGLRSHVFHMPRPTRDLWCVHNHFGYNYMPCEYVTNATRPSSVCPALPLLLPSIPVQNTSLVVSYQCKKGGYVTQRAGVVGVGIGVVGYLGVAEMTRGGRLI